MPKELLSKSPKVPSQGRALTQVKRAVELGHLEDLTAVIVPRVVPRFLVTYMLSLEGTSIRSATVVSVTNRAEQPVRVTIDWYKGFSDDDDPVGTTSMSIPADYTVDFASRTLPLELTTTNSVCDPELVFDEGRAVVRSNHPRLGVSARVYYTMGDRDERLVAVTDSKVVLYASGTAGE